MQWDDTPNAGFTTAAKPWLPIPPSAAQSYNVEAKARTPTQSSTPTSACGAPQTDPALRDGSYQAVTRTTPTSLRFCAKAGRDGSGGLEYERQGQDFVLPSDRLGSQSRPGHTTVWCAGNHRGSAAGPCCFAALWRAGGQGGIERRASQSPESGSRNEHRAVAGFSAAVRVFVLASLALHRCRIHEQREGKRGDRYALDREHRKRRHRPVSGGRGAIRGRAIRTRPIHRKTNRQQRAGLVEERRHLRDLPAQLSGLKRRWHRRPERHHCPPGLPENLGVDAIWLTPVYPSPQADFGYDISDYETSIRSTARSRTSTAWWPRLPSAISGC